MVVRGQDYVATAISKVTAEDGPLSIGEEDVKVGMEGGETRRMQVRFGVSFRVVDRSRWNSNDPHFASLRRS